MGPYTPVFTQPSAPGSVSNTLGSNTGADKIAFLEKYANPLGAADGPGAFRYQAWRTPSGSTNRILAADSFWLGTGNTQALPASLSPGGSLMALHPSASFVYNGRLYVFGETGAMNVAGNTSFNFSAPINGRNLGTWRNELPLPAAFSSNAGFNGHIPGACVVNGYAYVIGSEPSAFGDAMVYYSPILSDGTFGGWSSFIAGGSIAPQYIFGYTDAVGSYLGLIDVNNNTCFSTSLNADGTPVGTGGHTGGVGGGPLVTTWTNLTTIPGFTQTWDAVVVCLPSGANDGKANLFLIGGDNGASSVVATVQKSVLLRGAAASFTANAQSLPAARSWAMGAVANGFVYVIGGTSAVGTGGGGIITPASIQGTVYYISIANLIAGSVAWSTAATGLNVARAGGAAAGDSVLGPLVNNISASGLPGVSVAAGLIGPGGGNATTAESTGANATTGATGTWVVSGSGVLLAAADLGTGGAVTANQDGTWTLGWSYGAACAYLPITAFLNGDTVQIDTYQLDSSGADISPVGTVIFKCSAPPTLTNISPASGATVTTPVVPVSFTHLPSLGNSPQGSYRVQIWNVGQTVLYYDSGILPGQANSVTASTFPAFANGNYQLVITTFAADIPYQGSSVQATSSTPFTINATAASLPT